MIVQARHGSVRLSDDESRETRFSAEAASSDPTRESYCTVLRAHRFLWAHQNEILEAYNDKHLNTQDIALELPTGTGKTLIGLLIAEFRRRRLEDRALYLAPTRQLAHQVGGLARQYGIPAEVCLAPAYEGMNRWMLGGRIAVTVYSSLFNVNPVFGIPNTIILDDAHAAEDYLADH